MIIKLSEMKPGQEGIVRRFNNNEIFLKLMDLVNWWPYLILAFRRRSNLELKLSEHKT